MRKVLTFALAVALAAPFSVMAQNAPTAVSPAGALAGRSVDAMGRGVVGERVELVRGTTVVASVMTNGMGDWSFRGVEAGEYILRMNVRGRIAGLRVTVATGQSVAGTMIVVPAATASLQLGSLANLLTLLPTATATAVQTAVTVTAEVDTANLSPEIVQQVLQAMTPAERVAFAEAVIEAVNSLPPSQTSSAAAAPFANAVAALTQIVNTGGATVPVIPPVVTGSR